MIYDPSLGKYFPLFISNFLVSDPKWLFELMGCPTRVFKLGLWVASGAPEIKGH